MTNLERQIQYERDIMKLRSNVSWLNIYDVEMISSQIKNYVEYRIFWELKCSLVTMTFPGHE